MRNKVLLGAVFALLIIIAAAVTLPDSSKQIAAPPAIGESEVAEPRVTRDNFGMPDSPDLPEAPNYFEPPLVAITFDDGFETDYLITYPLLEKRNMVGTTYITTALIGTEGHLSWDQVQSLKAAGWTVGCHSHTHPRLTELTEQEIRAEMEKVDRAFKAQNLQPPRHHAYPFGALNEKVIEVIKEHRLSGRATVDGIPPGPGNNHLYRLQAHQLYLDDEQSLAEAIKIVDLAAENREVLILYTHEVKEEPGEYGAKPLYFARLLDYIEKRKLQTVNMDQLYQYLRCNRWDQFLHNSRKESFIPCFYCNGTGSPAAYFDHFESSSYNEKGTLLTR